MCTNLYLLFCCTIIRQIPTEMCFHVSYYALGRRKVTNPVPLTSSL